MAAILPRPNIFMYNGSTGELLIACNCCVKIYCAQYLSPGSNGVGKKTQHETRNISVLGIGEPYTIGIVVIAGHAQDV